MLCLTHLCHIWGSESVQQLGKLHRQALVEWFTGVALALTWLDILQAVNLRQHSTVHCQAHRKRKVECDKPCTPAPAGVGEVLAVRLSWGKF